MVAQDKNPLILVVEDIEETRDGIERLLKIDGYRVDPAREEQDAIQRAKRAKPDLILVSLGAPVTDVILKAFRIREHAGLSDDVPIVIFCVETVAEGAEIETEGRVYLTRPDNFDQLRQLLRRLLLGRRNPTI
jgi:two-component system, OmpR family, response regulator MprA